MGDSDGSKAGSGAGIKPPTSAAARKPEDRQGAAVAESRTSTTGRVVHDERGNAVWDWVKDTARTAIDSTSRLLKRLEVPELTLEDTRIEKLPQEPDRDAGGGYNPYGSSTSTGGRASGVRGVGLLSAPGGRGSGAARGSNAPDPGGGYDPYGKTVTRKPGRKM